MIGAYQAGLFRASGLGAGGSVKRMIGLAKNAPVRIAPNDLNVRKRSISVSLGKYQDGFAFWAKSISTAPALFDGQKSQRGFFNGVGRKLLATHACHRSMRLPNSFVEARRRNAELPAESSGEGALTLIAMLQGHLQNGLAFGQGSQ